jgi:regulator of cell morphogenesis and NO signaling
MTVATIEAQMADRTIQYLLEGHRTFDQAAQELAALVEGAEAAPGLDAAGRRRMAHLANVLEPEAASHMRKEEEVLFVALEAFLPRDVGPLAVLRGEHRDLAAHLAALVRTSEALAAGDAAAQAEALAAARAVLQLVRNHFYKEERVLFPMVARFLSPERDLHLLQAMQAMEPAPPRGAEGAKR